MSKICYLCGIEIPDGEISKDHVIPKQFIKRAQPKSKGFDYPGVLASHAKCNNEFGSEKYSQKALKMMKELQDNKCITTYQNTKYPHIRIMAINEDCFSDFNKDDLKFFKIIDVRNENYDSWTQPSFFTNKTKTNPKENALFTTLSVLTKSAAALLLAKSHFSSIPSFWRIVAIPYTDAKSMDFDDMYGQTKPFEDGIKVWIHKINKYAWQVIFKANDTMVFFYFITSQDEASLDFILNNFQDENAERFLFEGEQLNELVNYKWKLV